MCKSVQFVFIGLMPFLWAAFQLSAQEKSSPPPKSQDEQAVKYEAAEGIPKDKAAEKLRDYAVLEACLNDLASPKNPEYKHHIKNVGPGREILIDDATCKYDLLIELGTLLTTPGFSYIGSTWEGSILDEVTASSI
jgi:hypothetical protein